MSTKECFYCTGTGAIEVNDDFERTCGHCGGTGLDGNTLRDAAPYLLEAARAVIADIDGAGVPMSKSQIDTKALRAAIAKAEGGN